MAWSGYFMFGGTEIINATRTEAYARHFNVGWFKPVYRQPALSWLLDEPAYTTPLQDDAPWTDPDNLDTYDFYGCYPLDVTGIEDGTVDATVVESVNDGGFIGRTRKKTRTVVFSAVLVGASECAVEAGLRWLRSVLTGGPCFNQMYGVCGGADLCYLGCPPLIGETPATYSPGPLSLDRVNLATNPSAEVGGSSGWASSNPALYALSVDTSAPIGGLQSVLSTRQPVLDRTNLALNPISDSGNVTTWWAPTRAAAAANSGFLRMTINDAQAATFSQRISTPGSAADIQRILVNPGETVRVACQMRSSASFSMATNIQFRDAAGAVLTSPISPAVTTNPTTWTDLPDFSAVAPANTAYVSVQVGINGTGPRAVNDTFDVRHVIITKGTTATPYFDGGTAPSGGYTYRWTGAVNASTSERLGVADPVASSVVLSSGGALYPCQPGVPISVGVDVKVEQSTRQVSGHLSWDGDGVTSTVTVPAGAPGSVVRLVLTGTPPPGVTLMTPVVEVKAGSGNALSGERIWYDNLYVGGDVTGVYFDGSTPAQGEYSYSWAGTPDASVSRRYKKTYVLDPPESSESCYAKIGRSLHEVTTTVGPTVTNKIELLDGGCAWQVTWTMIAANPAEFGVEKPLVIGFLDPAVDIPYVGGVVPPGASFDEDGNVQSDPVCPVTVYRPVYDPTCTLLSPPPDVPTVVPTCFTFPVNFLRTSFTIPREEIPVWTHVTPVISLTTQDYEARSVRVRFYADMFDTGDPSTDPCNFCGDVVFSYIPPRSTIVLDCADHEVYVDQPGIGRRRADTLVSDSSGNPFEWPEFSCGFGYVVTVDMPQQLTHRPVLDLSLVPRMV